MSDDAIARALGYPYDPPNRSYVIHGDKVRWIDNDADLPRLSGRSPVLAVGSNQGPAQLARKFNPTTTGRNWGMIPVIRVELDNFDTVYSPHITAYGAIPATLQSAPGTSVSLFVTWLDGMQLGRMHETEITMANYVFGTLKNIDIRPEIGPSLTSVNIYASQHGILTHKGHPIPLSEVTATGRNWTSMTQKQVQGCIRDRMAPDQDLEAFILTSIQDRHVRNARTEALKQSSQPFQHANFHVQHSTR